jgi:hypothetical protein
MMKGPCHLHLSVTKILVSNTPSDAPFLVFWDFAFRHFGTPDDESS